MAATSKNLKVVKGDRVEFRSGKNIEVGQVAAVNIDERPGYWTTLWVTLDNGATSVIRPKSIVRVIEAA